MSEPEGRPEQQEQAPGGLAGVMLKGAAFAGVGYALTIVVNLGFALVLARVLDPSDFGEFAAGAVLIGIGMLVSDSGMMAALIHRRDRIDEAASTAVVSTVLAGFGLMAFALAVSPLLGLIFHSSTVRDVTAVTSGVLFLRATAIVPSALLQRRFSFLRRMVAEPLSAVAYGVAAVVAAHHGEGVWSLVIGAYAGALADVILSWALVRWRPRLRQVSVAMWRELIAYGRHVFVGTAVLDLGDQVPVFIIGRLLGAAPLGFFRYASRIALTPFGLILAGASYVLFPVLARIADDAERFQAAFRRSITGMAVIAMPVSLLLIPLGEPTATLVFGDRWAPAGQAAMALSILVAARSMDSAFSEGLKAAGHPQVLTRLHLVEIGVATVAMLALEPLGLNGVAAGMSVGATAGFAYAVGQVGAIFEIARRELLAAIIPQFACALLASGVVLAAELAVIDAASHGTLAGLALLLAEGLGGLLIYALALRVLAPSAFATIGSLVGRPAESAEFLDSSDDQGAAEMLSLP